MAKTTTKCDAALVACKKYVDLLEVDNKLLHTRADQLSKENNELISQVKKDNSPTQSRPLVAAIGIAVGGTSVAVGAPIIAVVVGVGSLVLALVGVK